MTTPYPGVLSLRNGGPVTYGENFWPANNDVVTFGFIVATFILFIALFLPFISLLRPQKIKDALYYSGFFVSIYVWCVIMICNFGKEWERGTVTTQTPFIPYHSTQITATVGLHIGLRGFNVTLLGTPEQQLNETINYNELFSWEWQQGVYGFGPYGGRIQIAVHEATVRGLPYPILWVAEWFTLEGDYIHWGRFARIAGWYCHILMWIALVCWALTNILFLISNTYFGSVGICITGTVMILANIVYSAVKNQNLNQLAIPFQDGFLTLTYGWCYYLNLFTGIFCVISGILLLVYLQFWQKRKGQGKEKEFFIKSEVVSDEINHDVDRAHTKYSKSLADVLGLADELVQIKEEIPLDVISETNEIIANDSQSDEEDDAMEDKEEVQEKVATKKRVTYSEFPPIEHH